MIHPRLLLSCWLAAALSAAAVTGRSNETSNNVDTGPGSDRQGRGILETIQGFIQTAQTVNKLFGGLNANTNSAPALQASGALAQVQSQDNRPQQWPKEPPGSTNFYNQYYNHGQSQASNYPAPQSVYPAASSSGSGSQGDGYQIGQSLQAQSEASAQHYPYQPHQHSNLYSEYYTGAVGQASDHKQVYYPGSVASVQNPQQGHHHPQQQQGPYVFGTGGQTPGGPGVNKQGADQPTSLSSLLGSLGGLSGLAGGGLGGAAGAGGAAGGIPGGSSDLLSTINSLGIFEDLSELISFQNVEKVLKNVNKFDSLKCIPRLVCQTIARRQYEAAQKEKQDEEYRRTSTTTTTTARPKKSRKGSSDRSRDGRLIPGFKIQGVDTALEQVVKFLDLMQLKDWSIYPYVEGAYQGHQVKHWDECAYKFNSCPFSDEQLLYYFNNYKGGLFQSFRSDLKP